VPLSRKNKVALIVFVVRPENLQSYVETAKGLFGIEFERMHGPTVGSTMMDWDAYIDYDSGIELVAPLGGTSITSANLVKFLDEHGEGLHAVVFGVEDLDAAVANAVTNGYEAGQYMAPLDDDVRRGFLESYTKKIVDIQEVRVHPQFLGLDIMFGKIAYSEDT
jgi:hypothetical protein